MATAELIRWRDRVRAHRTELLYTRLMVLILALWALIASAGWHSAGQHVRISIPPQLPYGGTFQADRHQPWQIFNFAGYIWQQYNTWTHNGEKDAPARLHNLAAFFTTAERARLQKELTERQRRGEMSGRVRTASPTGLYHSERVREQGADWIVELDLHIEETLNGIRVRSGLFRYALHVVAADLDPESNPWGLLLAGLHSVRKLESES